MEAVSLLAAGFPLKMNGAAAIRQRNRAAASGSEVCDNKIDGTGGKTIDPVWSVFASRVCEESTMP